VNELQKYFIWEFVEDYKDGFMSRRDMLKRVVYLTGGVASAASVLSLLGCGGSAAPASSAAPAAASSGAPAPAGSASAPGTSAASAPAKPSAAASSGASASAKPAGSGSAAASAKPAAGASASAGSRSPVSVAANDPAIDARDISFPGDGVTLLGYEARPKGAAGPLPLVLVVTMNVGLEDHIRDVTRRYAKEGYLAMSLDTLSRQGGTAKVDRAAIGAAMSQTGTEKYVGDFKSAIDYYSKQAIADVKRIGMTGFCIGGTITWRAAELIPQLKAAAPFYGSVPPLDAAKDIKAAMLGVYSADPQDNANKDRDQLDAALKAANVVHQFNVYPGTQHAFHDDTGARYNQEQALAAYRDTLAWFAKYVKG